VSGKSIDQPVENRTAFDFVGRRGGARNWIDKGRGNPRISGIDFPRIHQKLNIAKSNQVNIKLSFFFFFPFE